MTVVRRVESKMEDRQYKLMNRKLMMWKKKSLTVSMISETSKTVKIRKNQNKKEMTTGQEILCLHQLLLFNLSQMLLKRKTKSQQATTVLGISMMKLIVKRNKK